MNLVRNQNTFFGLYSSWKFIQLKKYIALLLAGQQLKHFESGLGILFEEYMN